LEVGSWKWVVGSGEEMGDGGRGNKMFVSDVFAVPAFPEWKSVGAEFFYSQLRIAILR
jgi:hypothetical protein